MERSINTKPSRPTIRSACLNENGAALVIGLMFIAILGMLGTTAYVMTTTDMQIGGNYKASVQASSAAEAGVSEALYRLSLFDDGGTVAPPSGSMINVNGLTDNNAAISIDPNGLLSNTLDDDGNGGVDDISDLNYNGTYDNRTWQTKIMLKTSDDADTTTTIYTPTIQPSASWIEYSASTDDGTALTIAFLKDTGDMDSDGNTSEIVFYNESLATPLNVDTVATPASGQPVVVIASSGRVVGSTRTLQIESTRQGVDIQAEAAVMVNMLPGFGGTPVISGFNYDGTVSSADDCLPNCPDDNRFTGNAADNHGGNETYGGPPPTHKNPDTDITIVEEQTDTETEIPYQSKLESSGHKPGVWSTVTGVDPSTGDVWGGNLAGTTSWKDDPAGGQTWLSLTEMLGLTQKQVDDMLLNANVTEADMHASSGKLETAPQGVIYIDNAGGNEVDITAATPGYQNGWGLMYVTGDLKISSGNFEFKGLIYVEGDIRCNGSPLIIGCLAAKGSSNGAFASGNPHIIYSYDALTEYANKGMRFIALSWKDEGVS